MLLICIEIKLILSFNFYNHNVTVGERVPLAFGNSQTNQCRY